MTYMTWVLGVVSEKHYGHVQGTTWAIRRGRRAAGETASVLHPYDGSCSFMPTPALFSVLSGRGLLSSWPCLSVCCTHNLWNNPLAPIFVCITSLFFFSFHLIFFFFIKPCGVGLLGLLFRLCSFILCTYVCVFMFVCVSLLISLLTCWNIRCQTGKGAVWLLFDMKLQNY